MNTNRILELVKVGLLLIIVILLSLNYFEGGSGSKYEMYDNGELRMNKVTGEVWELENVFDKRSYKYKDEYIKIKIKE